MEQVKWEDRVRNEEVLRRVGEERNMLEVIRKRKRNWIGHCWRRDCILKEGIEGMVEGKRERGKRRYQMLDNIQENKYSQMERLAMDRKKWKGFNP